MADLPIIALDFENKIWGLPEEGDLIYKYTPFQNLQNKEIEAEGDLGLTNLRMLASEANLNVDNPLHLGVDVTYDESVNLAITDNINPLKLVNSRFYLTSSDTYAIADRKGNLDTNIYTKEDFPAEASLIKKVRSIVTLNFDGVEDGGMLPVGNYNFYFKLADADGNESDFVSESGQVVCYIGTTNNPTSIRGGLLNENSNKLVKFTLSNLDMAYDYINVYYVRNTGEDMVKNSSIHKINHKFKISGESTPIIITGYEELEDLTNSDINLRYANFNSAKTITPCQNMMFVGNVTNNYELFETLEKYSLFIVPTLSGEENIGNVNNSYQGVGNNSNEYYNPKNIYYRLGYWDEEIYRLGIVYIMNDFSLSPVFNIRGKKEILELTDAFSGTGSFSTLNIQEELNFNEEYIIEGTDENTKGVFKINADNINIFNGNHKVTPVGIKLNFQDEIMNGVGALPAISDITKGFFIVRQQRIPDILAQGVTMGTTEKGDIPTIKASTTKGAGFFTESFLSNNEGDIPLLQRDIYPISEDLVKSDALLCPEAEMRNSIFESLFNSSEFKLRQSKYQPTVKYKFLKLDTENNLFGLSNLEKRFDPDTEDFTPGELNTDLLFIQTNTVTTNNKDKKFSSVAGLDREAWTYIDPENGNIEDVLSLIPDASVDELSNSPNKTRGIFNSYVGSSKDITNFDNPDINSSAEYFNIYNKNYNFSEDWKEYFKIRYNDSSPFFPISDRITWNKPTEDDIEDYSAVCYRGDCYINTYTHKMMWNFIEPELPTNKRIVDRYTWFKNYKVKNLDIKIGHNGLVAQDNDDEFTQVKDTLTYVKSIPLFTYKVGELQDDIDIGKELDDAKILTPEARKYSKYAESNGTFGYEKMNRPDVNAVPLGHWVTFKVCSNVNLGLRDEDFSEAAEEALHKKRRSFYPYSSADQHHKLDESTVINAGISKTLGIKKYYEIPDVPFIKTHFTNRIYHSNLSIDSVFKDGGRIFSSSNYQDYTMEYGALTRLIEWYGTLVAVMQHGILMIPVNERALMQNASGENVYINTEKVLPKNPKVLSNTFGSVWSSAVGHSESYIYGIDTIGKKIWRTNGEIFELISDMKIQKFLNDNINLKVTDKDEGIDFNLIKVHYNAFKHDIIFTYKYNLEKWVLCWNELQNKWVTRYTWFPEFSENINNIFYTFANKTEHLDSFGKLYKHGFAGTLEERGYIKPTVWYEEQHPFEFEFVISDVQGIQKIFDNLKIISNKAEPSSFTYEVVGEGYAWYKYKEVISWMENHGDFNTGSATEAVEFSITENGYYNIIENPEIEYYLTGYEYLLTHTIEDIEAAYPEFPTPYGMSGTDRFVKLPYIPKIKTQSVLDNIDWEALDYDTSLINDLWNGEDRVLKYQEGKTIHKVGRLRGNMDYVEDSWDIQIQPIKFRYAFMEGPDLTFSKIHEMRIRDKYIKIRVKYDGSRLAIINAIRTFFTISHA